MKWPLVLRSTLETREKALEAHADYLRKTHEETVDRLHREMDEVVRPLVERNIGTSVEYAPDVDRATYCLGIKRDFLRLLDRLGDSGVRSVVRITATRMVTDVIETARRKHR